KRFDRAETFCRKCLEECEARQPQAWTTFRARSLLGETLLAQEKYAEAEPLLLQAHKGMKEQEAAMPPAGREHLAETLERLVRLYGGWGRSEQAASWRATLAAHRKTGQK